VQTRAELVQGTTTVAVDEGAEAFVRLLTHCGIEYLFLNPGTDTFPVQEAIAKLRFLGEAAPRVVTCLHEGVALAAAHGYWQATGRPQAVLVHVDAGTLNIGGNLHNAQRDRAAILFCAGRSPISSEGELRGSKSSAIHWWQEQRDQHAIVPNYVKWDYELRRNETIHRVVPRPSTWAIPPRPTWSRPTLFSCWTWTCPTSQPCSVPARMPGSSPSTSTP